MPKNLACEEAPGKLERGALRFCVQHRSGPTSQKEAWILKIQQSKPAQGSQAQVKKKSAVGFVPECEGHLGKEWGDFKFIEFQIPAQSSIQQLKTSTPLEVKE